jgi:hypothetical protein
MMASHYRQGLSRIPVNSYVTWWLVITPFDHVQNATLDQEIPVDKKCHGLVYIRVFEMGMGQNLVPLVNIKIAGIYGCSSH